jgi:GTPase SAR1 family protein
MNDQIRLSHNQSSGMTSTSSRAPSPGDGSRGRLQGLFDRLQQAAPETLTTEAQQELKSLARKFQESQFYLVFLGQFKRGKTTLLNVLLGADLLPTGVLPLTSIVTIVRYAHRAWARVRFNSGTTREISTQHLAAYVTERGNPRNKKGVAEVEVFFPAPRLKGGLCLVDTPGIGSIFEHNTQVSYEFVPRADAAIFVFSPDAPLSQVELEFLHHLRAHVEKIFFVMNKSDQVTEAECAEILDFVRQAIREQVPSGELRFFAVSARQGLDAERDGDRSKLDSSALPGLLGTLDHFLSTHGGEMLIRSTCSALRRLISNELLGYEIEERAVAASATELEEKMRAIQETWQAQEQRHREAGYILRGEIGALEADLEKKLNDFVQAEHANLVKHMKSKLREQQNASKRRLVRFLDAELHSKIAEIIEEWKIREEETVAEAFESLTSRFSQEATETVEQIQQAAAQQFGFTWKAAPLPDRLSTQSRFHIKVDELTGWGLGQFPFLLPKPLFTRYLESRIQQTCLEELYRNSGRLKADLGDRLEESLRAYLAALDRHVEGARISVLAALNRAAAQQKSAQSKNQEGRDRQSSRLKLLRDIEAELAEIAPGCVKFSSVG